MKTRPKNKHYDKVQWRDSDTAIAQRLGVTRQAVTAARKNHTHIPSPSGHGGLRPNSNGPKNPRNQYSHAR